MSDEIPPEDLVRLTVNILKANAQRINRLSEMTGLSKTDCVNRGIAYLRVASGKCVPAEA